jgi:hypothetical protein
VFVPGLKEKVWVPVVVQRRRALMGVQGVEIGAVDFTGDTWPAFPAPRSEALHITPA